MYTLAIDLGGTRIKAGLLDGKKLVDSCSEKASSEKGLQNSLPLIEKMVDCLLENQNISGKELSLRWLIHPVQFPNKICMCPQLINSLSKSVESASLSRKCARMVLGEWRYG